MKEIWKDIIGYEGYQVSNLGRVRTHNKTTFTEKHGTRVWTDRILKQKVSKKDNCSRIELWKNGEHKTVLVHRIVATAFLGHTDRNMTVNHKDGNRQNNSVDNLEWLSRADNIKYGFEHGQYSTCKRCKLSCIKNGKEHHYNFRSLSEASKFIGRNNNYLSTKIKRGGKIIGSDGTEYFLENNFLIGGKYERKHGQRF